MDPGPFVSPAMDGQTNRLFHPHDLDSNLQNRWDLPMVALAYHILRMDGAQHLEVFRIHHALVDVVFPKTVRVLSDPVSRIHHGIHTDP